MWTLMHLWEMILRNEGGVQRESSKKRWNCTHTVLKLHLSGWLSDNIYVNVRPWAMEGLILQLFFFHKTKQKYSHWLFERCLVELPTKKELLGKEIVIGFTQQLQLYCTLIHKPHIWQGLNKVGSYFYNKIK